MARVYGESGRYVRQEAVKKRRKVVTGAMVSIAAVAALAGLSVAHTLRINTLSFWLGNLLTLACALAMWLVGKWSLKKLDALERDRVHTSKGATGEVVVAHLLSQFADEFHVINDLATPFGNLDHVVVGPTGVYILETKNWRGIVAADGKGELHLNARPLDKSYIRQFIGRIMAIKERAKALTNGLDPYFQAVFVFTSARVEAKWGSTGCAHCMTDEQLRNYIVENPRGAVLSAAQVKTLSQAFLGLAHMESDFAAQPDLFQPRTETQLAARTRHPKPVAAYATRIPAALRVPRAPTHRPA